MYICTSSSVIKYWNYYAVLYKVYIVRIASARNEETFEDSAYRPLQRNRPKNTGTGAHVPAYA